MRTVLLMLGAAVAQAQPTTYVIDDAQTELVATLKPAGLFGGHAHALRATRVSGSVSHDPAAPETSSVDITFPVDGLENDAPLIRKKVGLPEFNQADRAAVATNLRSASQLDVKRYPTIRFVAKRATGSGQALELEGALLIRGVEAKVKVPVVFRITDGVLTGTGRFSITHAMFGFKPYSALFGAVGNAENIEVRVTVVGRSAGPPPISP